MCQSVAAWPGFSRRATARKRLPPRATSWSGPTSGGWGAVPRELVTVRFAAEPDTPFRLAPYRGDGNRPSMHFDVARSNPASPIVELHVRVLGEERHRH